MSGQKTGRNDGNRVNRAVEFIRRRYPVKTGAAFEAETGISAETFRKWCEGAGRPSFDHYNTLIEHYGLPFLWAVLADYRPSWLTAAYADEENDRIEREIAELRERQRQLGAF